MNPLSFYVELERFEERAISHWNALKDAMRRLNRSVLQWQLIKSELLELCSLQANSLALFTMFGTLMQRFQEPQFSHLYPQKRARIIQLNERLAHSTQRLRDKCEILRQRIEEEEKAESLRTVEV